MMSGKDSELAPTGIWGLWKNRAPKNLAHRHPVDPPQQHFYLTQYMAAQAGPTYQEGGVRNLPEKNGGKQNTIFYTPAADFSLFVA